jgi:hypothetical protein
VPLGTVVSVHGDELQETVTCVLPLSRTTLYPVGVAPALGAFQVIVTGLGPLDVDPLPAFATTLVGGLIAPTLAAPLPLPLDA